jgi:hypothetical protein
VLLVKRQRLKAEGVEPGIVAATRAGLALGGEQQVCAQTLPTPAILHQQHFDAQPATIGEAKDSADDLALWIARKDRQPAFSMIADLRKVVGDYRIIHFAHILG